MVDTKTKLCIFVSLVFVVSFVMLISMVASGRALNQTLQNFTLAEMKNSHETNETVQIGNLRSKRQTGGKYSEAAKMSQMRLLRTFLQMFRNLWSTSYVGGGHPLHHEVPKPAVKAYKDKISSFLFPPKDQDEDGAGQT